MRIVQLIDHGGTKGIGEVIDDNSIRLIRNFQSIYDAANTALASSDSLAQLLREADFEETLDYDKIYNGIGEWRLRPAADMIDPSHCLVTGTGLSHRKSADNRNSMHSASGTDSSKSEAAVTDSMRIYQWGEAGGRPEPGKIGAQPEWFWKGDGAILCGHGDALYAPSFGEDGGEEAEIAGIYIVNDFGDVFRIGFTQANEFSDHIMESRNYLYLAPSKLRNCSIGPEVIVDGSFQNVTGLVSIDRDGKNVWQQNIASGEDNMVHSLANLEHHHFKYPQHRVPERLHVHFFGTPGFSYGAGVKLRDGDMMTVSFDGFGRPLQNKLSISTWDHDKVWEVKQL